MMKNYIRNALFILALLLQAPCCFAAELLAIAGNDYSIYEICLDDAGDYCLKNDFRQDDFRFQAGSDFIIATLENGKSLLDTSNAALQRGFRASAGATKQPSARGLKNMSTAFPASA